MKKLLVVEDEDVILKALKRLLERNHYSIQTATTVEEALQAEPQSFDLILADLRLPGAEGTAIIPSAGAHASVRSAVDAMRSGAMDYIAKPFDHDELLMVIERALLQNMLQAQNQSLKLELIRNQITSDTFESPAISRLLKQQDPSLDSHKFQHFYGERGTERESLARAMHERSERQDAPFVVADIGAGISDTNAVQLFGPDDASRSEGVLPPGGLVQAAQNGCLVLRHPELLAHNIQERLSDALTKRVLPFAA